MFKWHLNHVWVVWDIWVELCCVSAGWVVSCLWFILTELSLSSLSCVCFFCAMFELLLWCLSRLICSHCSNCVWVYKAAYVSGVWILCDVLNCVVIVCVIFVWCLIWLTRVWCVLFAVWVIHVVFELFEQYLSCLSTNWVVWAAFGFESCIDH